MLALGRDAPLCRRAFADRALSAAETAVGPWVLFEFGPDAGAGRARGFSGLYWAGFGALSSGGKRWAYELKQRADEEFARSGVCESAAALLEEALRRYPHWPSEAERLAQWLESLGRSERAAQWRAAAAEMAVMECAAYVKFRNGVEFLGVSGIPAQARPGETLRVKYFWRCPSGFSPARPLSVFVHFILDDRLVFQDDRALLEGLDWRYQPLPEIFIEERGILIPPEAPEGGYEMRLGLFSPEDDGARAAFRTKLPARRRSTKLPVALEIRR